MPREARTTYGLSDLCSSALSALGFLRVLPFLRDQTYFPSTENASSTLPGIPFCT